jgi:D-alanyl-D-alanine carboxypeptidase/D-alanyl-D-alanine-endopeptidase (penicillin-binding protein 4)
VTVAGRIAIIALLVLALAIPIAALLVLRSWVADANEDAERLDARFVAAAPADLSSAATPALSARRIPEELVEPQADRALANRLTQLVAEQPGPSCLVVEVDGRPIVAHQPTTALIPASVSKAVTAVAVLDHIGPEERFATRLVTDAPVVDGVVQGDLWIVGGGDPVLTSPDYAAALSRPQVRTPFEELAVQLAGAGITTIEGRILGDDLRYDQEREVDAWPSRYVDEGSVGPLSALSVDDGRERSGDSYEPSGDPPRSAAEQLDAALEAAGIQVNGGEARGAPAPLEPQVLVEVTSPPVAEIIQQMLQESDNNTAELLVKELGLRIGGTGTTEAGATVVRQSLEQRGLDPAQFSVVDGSGLARENLQSCQAIETLLDESPPGTVVGDGLAVAGRSGTLTNRYADSPLAGVLRAKTGSLNEVATLAGIVPTADGLIDFVQLLNGLPIEDEAGTTLQDRLVEILATWPERPDPEQVAPPAG